MICSYCQKTIVKNLTLYEIFLPVKPEKSNLCEECSHQFEFLSSKDQCFGCQRSSIKKYCQECLQWQALYPDYSFKHEALYTYNHAMKKWFEEYKFQGNYDLRHCFSKQLHTYFAKKKNKVIIPIPISKERMLERGFNQVEGLLTSANVAYQPLLIRTENTQAQSQKTKKERIKTSQPFQLTEKGKQLIRNQEILLVDDIYTTGRTMFHGAEIILQAKPNHLSTFSLAR